MAPDDLEKLLSELDRELARSPAARLCVVGRSAVAHRIVAHVTTRGFRTNLVGLYAPDGRAEPVGPPEFRHIDGLSEGRPDIVVIAEDAGKEALLDELAARLPPGIKVLIGGYGHLAFRDETFARIVREGLVPSLANGYPHCLIHLYQCLQGAARLGLQGIVAEFGMFRGGTTMLLSRFAEELGADWRVIGFDTFDGFPAPRSPLDMYAHPDCVFLDESAVRRYLEGRYVEVVAGDVVDTVRRLVDERIVLAFVDTDNHTSASRILDVVADRVVAGGAIVFDHWAGAGRHLYTVGERMAARRLAEDARFFNLHGTGVFLRVR